MEKLVKARELDCEPCHSGGTTCPVHWCVPSAQHKAGHLSELKRCLLNKCVGYGKRKVRVTGLGWVYRAGLKRKESSLGSALAVGLATW